MTAYICGECKQPWPTFRLAADCHPGIGGVEEVPPATRTRDPWGTGPLAARRAAAREIARMASFKDRLATIRTQIALQRARILALAAELNGPRELQHAAAECALALAQLDEFEAGISV